LFSFELLFFSRISIMFQFWRCSKSGIPRHRCQGSSFQLHPHVPLPLPILCHQVHPGQSPLFQLQLLLCRFHSLLLCQFLSLPYLRVLRLFFILILPLLSFLPLRVLHS
jgi:hypothetical protein